jgi:hypothetical protein
MSQVALATPPTVPDRGAFAGHRRPQRHLPPWACRAAAHATPPPASTGCPRSWGPSLTGIRAAQITRFGGPEVLDVVDLPDPTPGDGEQLFEISSSGVNYADTHHRLSAD